MRCAIFLDFDNVVLGLREGAGLETALRFAQEPQAWLAWLAGERKRRFLIRRCYMNPAGFLEEAPGMRHYFGQLRRAFMGAGFEVVDCPRMTRLKNAADVRLVLDVMDSLAGPAEIEEFTLLSTDADFVPLLLRLRAQDRRTRLVAHPEVGRTVSASADEVIGLDELARALGWSAEDATEAPRFGHDAGEEILAAVRDILNEAQAPVALPELGQEVRRRTGLSLRDSAYAGFGSLEELLDAAGGFVRMEGPGGGWAWRAGEPSDAAADATASTDSPASGS
jgi:uncharacterized LabA/DUF88 family protein